MTHHTILAFEPGDTLLARYRLQRILGQGGMGAVWLATDLTLDHPVAVKMLPAALSRDKRAVARLKEEAKRNLDLTHPHIVRLHTFEQDPARGDAAFLVMRYIEGQTLNDLLADHPQGLPLEQVRAWAAQIAEAIDFAHAKGVLHRDIKPGNIIIEASSGRAYLMDFGIAREARDTMTRVTGQQHDSSGTLPYMSPQQLIGQNHRSNDIYSFAATLYECLCGRPPFHTGDIAYQIRELKPEPLVEHAASWNDVVLPALAKDTETRPATAGAMLAGHARSEPAPTSRAPSGASVTDSRPLLMPEAPSWMNEKERLARTVTWREALAGKASAMRDVAWWFDQDSRDRLDWMVRAVEAGDADAMVTLGSMAERYLKSQQRPADQADVDAEALRWYRKAMETGSARAALALGDISRHGRHGVEKDWEDAARWYTAASRSPSAEVRASAFIMLAELHESGGPGLAADPDLAVNLYLESARIASNERERGDALEPVLRRHPEHAGKVLRVIHEKCAEPWRMIWSLRIHAASVPSWRNESIRALLKHPRGSMLARNWALGIAAWVLVALLPVGVNLGLLPGFLSYRRLPMGALYAVMTFALGLGIVLSLICTVWVIVCMLRRRHLVDGPAVLTVSLSFPWIFAILGWWPQGFTLSGFAHAATLVGQTTLVAMVGAAAVSAFLGFNEGEMASGMTGRRRAWVMGIVVVGVGVAVAAILSSLLLPVSTD